MKGTTERNVSVWMLALVGMLLFGFSAFATEPDGMKMDGKKGEMIQGGQMNADEMVKKGDEMIAQGKEMKKQGMMMKKKEMKSGSMKQDKMMNGNGMTGDKMNGKGTE